MTRVTNEKVGDVSENRHGPNVVSLISSDCEGFFLDKVHEASSVHASGILSVCLCTLNCTSELSWLTTFIFMNFLHFILSIALQTFILCIVMLRIQHPARI